MFRYFLDTSALVKHYHTEPGSPKIDAIWGDPLADLSITRLASTEFFSAIASKLRAPPQFEILSRRFLADVVRRRKPRIARLLRSHFQDAEALLCSYGLSGRLRANDALQLSAALQLRRDARLDCFVCADKDLLAAAEAAGLSCIEAP